MPVETDLKTAYKLLYEDHEPLKALQQYDVILKHYPDNLVATIYKAAALEKLHFGSTDWHNDQTLVNARELLSHALSLAQKRGDRSKIALVYFRHFIHYFNAKKYQEALVYMNKCKEYGYSDATLPMWQYQLDRKLEKMTKKGKAVEEIQMDPTENTELSTSNATFKQPASDEIASESLPAKNASPNFRTDWYQTNKKVVLSIFTTNLPQNKECIKLRISPENKKDLELSYELPGIGSEFQYSVTLAHEVEPHDIKLSVYTKKMEITLTKVASITWKTLEYMADSDKTVSVAECEDQPSDKKTKMALSYPTSSKKNIDWSKVDLGDEEDEDSGSADAFFQKLYADADPDMQRAMMKSYIESNGTALNTNWEDVSKKRVETSPPEGTELKHW